MKISRREFTLKEGLKWSLGLHFFLIALLAFKGALTPPPPAYIPSLRVDVVDLPDALKKDLHLINDKRPDLTRDNAPSAVAPPAALPEEIPNDPTDTPSEMTLKKVKKALKKELSEQKKKPETESEKKRHQKIDSALSRIKSLAKIQDESETTPDEGTVVKGNALSPGSSLSSEAKEGAQNEYYDSVLALLRRHWALPIWLARQKLSAQVLVTIDHRGLIQSLVFQKSSGHTAFDEAVRKTLGDAQPFPPPPSALRASVGERGILFGFPL